MSEQSLEQTLSALMDGEASELELQRILRQLNEPEVRKAWQSLHQLRSAMHQEPFVDVDVSAGVMAALADTEMDAAPGTKAVDSSRSRNSSGWKSWQRMAVAASVTLAVLGGVRFYNQVQLPSAEQTLARTAVPAVQQPQQPRSPAYLREGPVVLASYSGQTRQEEQQDAELSTQWHREQLPLYLKQHAQQSGNGGAEGALPYARAASMEGR